MDPTNVKNSNLKSANFGFAKPQVSGEVPLWHHSYFPNWTCNLVMPTQGPFMNANLVILATA